MKHTSKLADACSKNINTNNNTKKLKTWSCYFSIWNTFVTFKLERNSIECVTSAVKIRELHIFVKEMKYKPLVSLYFHAKFQHWCVGKKNYRKGCLSYLLAFEKSKYHKHNK
mmetsp:Transcript_27514/g.33690  ORF Transcript_27514/g.33690 Transcript_27514/m.33690 type:complete len:112 (-) Transcript_27514:75-410(-)